MRKLLIFIFVLSGFAQAQTVKQALLYGDKRAEVNDYFGALSYYQVAKDLDSNSIEVLWKYAEALRGISDYKNAEYYYAKVYQKGGKRLYPESIFWLATMQKHNGNYSQSYDSWKTVKKSLGKKSSSYYGRKSRQEMASCDWAKKNSKDSLIPYNVESLSALNSSFADFSLRKFGDTILFSSMRTDQMNRQMEISDKDYHIRIWMTDGNFKEIKMADTQLNIPASNNGEACLSPDKKRLYFTHCEDGKPCKIWVSKIKNGTFQPADILGVVNEEGFSSAQPFVCMIQDKEYLFFASDMEKGQGGMDIWYSIVSDGNNYSKPKNAGKTINTPDDDIAPFYNSNEQHLYFSSSWHYGFGGMDIFYATFDGNRFGSPLNAGLPVNSSANDLYYFSISDKEVYLSSNRAGGLLDYSSACCNDIYKLSLPKEPEPESPYSSLENLNKYLPVTLYFHNDRPGPNSLDTFTVLSYIETYNRYKDLLDKYKSEYASGLSGENQENAIEEMENFFIEKVDKGVRDLAEFTRLLLIELKKGQRIEMSVQGFASPLAKTDYNVNLTLRRVSSMINYLREYENGIFIPYINGTAPNGGVLTFNKIPFGEYSADQTISDNPNDQKNSVYSIRAASERKIEIQSVQQAAERDSVYAEFYAEKYLADLGQFNSTGDITVSFNYKNTGDADLIIDSIQLNQHLELLTYDEKLAPKQASQIKIKLTPLGLDGHQRLKLTVFSNGIPKEVELSVVFEIVD